MQASFSKNKKVSLDTLILQKILIHNFKSKLYYFYCREHKDNNWSYAFPEQIYEQINMYAKDCVEIRYLFEILQLLINPIIREEPDWNEWENIPVYEIRLYSQKRFYERSTNTIISRLHQVIEKLNTEEKFKEYHHLIPKFDIEQFKDNRWQFDYKLNLDSIKNIYEKKHQGITRGS